MEPQHWLPAVVRGSWQGPPVERHLPSVTGQIVLLRRTGKHACYMLASLVASGHRLSEVVSQREGCAALIFPGRFPGAPGKIVGVDAMPRHQLSLPAVLGPSIEGEPVAMREQHWGETTLFW